MDKFVQAYLTEKNSKGYSKIEESPFAGNLDDQTDRKSVV